MRLYANVLSSPQVIVRGLSSSATEGVLKLFHRCE
jgi:hypothetical protein